MKKWLFLGLVISIFTSLNFAHSDSAPNGPGNQGVWSRPDKQAFLATERQNLWATVADGIVTEIYYPTVDRAQTKDTQLLLVIGNTILEERKDFHHFVTRYPKSLAFHVKSVNEAMRVTIEKDFTLDPKRAVLLEYYNISFAAPQDVKVYVLHNPSADNTAGGDSAFVNVTADRPGEMLAYQSDRRGDEPVSLQRRTFQYLQLDRPATEGSAGFEGVNDPWTQLHLRGTLAQPYLSAQDGNVAGTLGFKFSGQNLKFKFAIAFAEETTDTLSVLRQMTSASLQTSGQDVLLGQQQEWGAYLSSLNSVGQNPRLESHVLVIRGLEDKIHPGAIIAGPSLPAIPDSLEARETNYEMARLRQSDMNGGYHRVWPRDSVQMSLGLLAAGDLVTPLRVLRQLRSLQSPAGTLPQNAWVDGQTSWNAFQLDETAFPIILASRLIELGGASYSEFRPMVIAAADALVKRGPWTDQERWEENHGLSPNTIAIAVQALNEAAYLETSIDQSRSQLYASTSQKWKDNIYKWTFIDNGPLGQNYFERIEVSPDFSHTAPLFIQNQPVGGNTFSENEIIDGGFIQWIISGLIPANDSHFTSSLAVYDRSARASAFGAQGYLRYNHDGFGPGHIGRAWPLLSGERALAALVRGEDPSEHLGVLSRSVTSAGMACEQTDVSDCPLGWAHAEMLIVGRSMTDHRSFYISKHP